MKKSLLIVSLFLLFSSVTRAETASFAFFAGSFEEMQTQALRENRPYFINFYTSWCSPCSQMNESTFASEALTDYVAANYLAYSADAESFADGGIVLAETYQVLFYPTILVFNPEGELLHKSTGFKQAPDLLSILKQYRFDNTAKPATNSPVVVATPKTEPVKPTPPRPVPTGSSQSPTGQGLFQVSVSPQASAGFGVQIGVFGDYENVLKEVQILEAAFHDNVLLHVTTLQGKTAFRVILGPFATRAQADSYKQSLKKNEGRDGWVVDLRSMK